MTVTIIDYGVGNVASIANIVRHIGGSAVVCGDPDDLRKADRIALPGVGAFDAARQKMADSDIDQAVVECARKGTPILGICLGMQLLTRGSEEGRLGGLGLISASARRFSSAGRLPVPHMGWNEVRNCKQSALFADDHKPRFYFVHSYYVECDDDDDIAGATDYGTEFVSAFEHENILGVQFHPEKSHSFGMELFRRFLQWRPS